MSSPRLPARDPRHLVGVDLATFLVAAVEEFLAAGLRPTSSARSATTPRAMTAASRRLGWTHC